VNYRAFYSFFLRLRTAVVTLLSTFHFKKSATLSGAGIKVVFPASLNIRGRLDVGDDFFCGPSLYYSSNDYSVVRIGSSVMFGPFVKVISGNHMLDSVKKHMRYIHEDDPRTKPIVIEDGVWIGAGATILSGAYISEGVVVGSGAVVSSHIPPYCVAVGVPAKKIRRRFTDEQLQVMIGNVSSDYSFEEIILQYRKYLE